MTTNGESNTSKTSVLPWVIATGAVTFALGVTGALLFSQSRQNSQTELLAAMTTQMMQMQQNNVTRNTSTDLLAVGSASNEVTPFQAAIAPKPTPQIPTQSEQVATIPSASSNLQNNVNLAQFTKIERTQDEKIAEALAIANRNQLRMVTEGVVAGLYTVNNSNQDGNSNFGINSVNAPSAVTDLENLLESAVKNGDLKLPEAIATNSGSLDSRTLLFDLVQQSLAKGSQKEVQAANELRKRAFEASTAKSQTINGERFYVVESGDSLAYISLLFYGSTRGYSDIFNANKQFLSSPDKIQVGQRLRIPSA